MLDGIKPLEPPDRPRLDRGIGRLALVEVAMHARWAFWILGQVPHGPPQQRRVLAELPGFAVLAHRSPERDLADIQGGDRLGQADDQALEHFTLRSAICAGLP